MNHVVLLGDSIFDNAAYVRRGASVIHHLQAELGPTWKASLLAVDGDVTGQVVHQLGNVPVDATHLIVSAGGNDALRQASVLTDRASSVAAVLERMREIAGVFEEGYLRMTEAVLSYRRPTALCTIYHPFFEEGRRYRASMAALTVFNDCIIRAAAGRGLPLLDLRLVCDERRDFAHEIEPSESGGLKIARAIRRLLAEHDFTTGRATIYV